MSDQASVGIAVPLEPELVQRLGPVDPRLEILYHPPKLLPPVRYPCDHRGVDGFERSDHDERRWREMIARSEVLFGIPGDSPDGLADALRAGDRLRWVQATAAGAGEQARTAGLTPEELERVAVTSASGVHAVPLAEFCLLGLLAFTKGLPRLREDQRAQRWDHYPMAELRGRTVLIVGFGKIGAEVARLADAFGMRVIAINHGGVTDSPHVHEAARVEGLGEWLPQADAIVITLPLTDETRGLIDETAIARIKPGAVFVNVGRGGVVDEPALVRALREERLAARRSMCSRRSR